MISIVIVLIEAPAANRETCGLLGTGQARAETAGSRMENDLGFLAKFGFGGLGV